MRHLNILHVEANQEDAQLLVRACDAAGLPADFFRVKDFPEAIMYMQGEGAFADKQSHPLPDVVVLSTDSDGRGIEFLRWLRREAKFDSIPVLVFSESANAEDRSRAMQEGATGYFVKPRNGETMKCLDEFFRRLDGDGANKK